MLRVTIKIKVWRFAFNWEGTKEEAVKFIEGELGTEGYAVEFDEVKK